VASLFVVKLFKHGDQLRMSFHATACLLLTHRYSSTCRSERTGMICWAATARTSAGTE
jgi:hypothetical protein